MNKENTKGFSKLSMEKRTAGIILATGYGSDGSAVDPMQELGSTSILRRHVLTMQLAGISPIVVLSGWNSLSTEHHLDNYGVVFFQMHDFMEKDLHANVLPMLEYLWGKCDQFVFSPVEFPLLRTNTLKKLMEADADVRYPIYGKTKGFPAVISMSALQNLDWDEANQYEIFEDFLAGSGIEEKLIPVDDEGVICNIRDYEKCEGILFEYNKQMQHPFVKLDLDFDSKVFDIRLKMLLMMIKETHSVKKACSRISMSVGKAWEYIDKLENALDYPVVERRQGGKRGGGTTLTPEGEEYLEKYCELERRLKEFVSSEFARIFETDIQ